MGERDIFPHVGRDTEIDLEGARGRVYPITTYVITHVSSSFTLFISNIGCPGERLVVWTSFTV